MVPVNRALARVYRVLRFSIGQRASVLPQIGKYQGLCAIYKCKQLETCISSSAFPLHVTFMSFYTHGPGVHTANYYQKEAAEPHETRTSV